MVQEAIAPTAHHPEAPARQRPYGIVADFATPEELIEAARRAREAGYTKMDGYSPFPIEGLDDALGLKDTWVPWIMFAAGVSGGLLGFGFLCFCVVFDYPLNIGGRPIFAWPSFVPITFEITVLLTSVTGIVAMFGLNGLPMPHHPLFDAPGFDRASSSRFFLCVEGDDPQFDRHETRRFMENLGSARVSEVENTRWDE